MLRKFIVERLINLENPLIHLNKLEVKIPLKTTWNKGKLVKQSITAVNEVDIKIFKGEIYGLVGESGSGKSTTARTIVGLQKATAGAITFENHNLTELSTRDLKKFSSAIQMVFQDPFSSLNPRKSIGTILEEPLKIHTSLSNTDRQEKVFDLLKTVGLQPDSYFRFPHEFSGGQRQRIGIARAIILNPRFLICDEPVSALDVSIQSQVLNLLKKLQKEMQLTMLFITHDMSVVHYIADRIGVMYLGSIIEEATTEKLFTNPLHPYTKALLSTIPTFNERKRERIHLRGEIPSPLNPPTGCVFHTRCPIATDICKSKKPDLRELEHQHVVACHNL